MNRLLYRSWKLATAGIRYVLSDPCDEGLFDETYSQRWSNARNIHNCRIYDLRESPPLMIKILFELNKMTL